jgi:hypothetical protein
MPSLLKSCSLVVGAVTVVPICTVRLASALTLPAASVARTLKTYVPLTCASHVFGEAQVGSQIALLGSRWHSNLAPASPVKFSVGVLSRLGEDGNGAVTEAAGAAVSTVIVSVAEVRNCGCEGSVAKAGLVMRACTR